MQMIEGGAMAVRVVGRPKERTVGRQGNGVKILLRP